MILKKNIMINLIKKVRKEKDNFSLISCTLGFAHM